jgi:hypothetical protein
MRSLSGSVVYTGAVAKAGRYELQTHSGNVSFTPVGAAGYALDAATFSGTIIPPPGMAAERLSGRGARQFHGTIGSGGASVSITTFSGDITVGAR